MRVGNMGDIDMSVGYWICVLKICGGERERDRREYRV